jgi:hypothetical protein
MIDKIISEELKVNKNYFADFRKNFWKMAAFWRTSKLQEDKARQSTAIRLLWIPIDQPDAY